MLRTVFRVVIALASGTCLIGMMLMPIAEAQVACCESQPIKIGLVGYEPQIGEPWQTVITTMDQKFVEEGVQVRYYNVNSYGKVNNFVASPLTDEMDWYKFIETYSEEQLESMDFIVAEGRWLNQEESKLVFSTIRVGQIPTLAWGPEQDIDLNIMTEAPVWYFAHSPVGDGKASGLWGAEYLGWEGNVTIVTESKNEARVRGIKEILSKYEDIQLDIVEIVGGEDDPELFAISDADLIYGTSGLAFASIMAALGKAGLEGEVATIGFDATPDAVSGKGSFGMVSSGQLSGRAMASAMVELMAGESVSQIWFAPQRIVDNQGGTLWGE